MTQVDYDCVSFVVSSQYRQAVIDNLTHPKTPSKLEESTGHDMAHLSRALTELREKGLVELLVDEDRKKGRLYDLTDDGQAIVDEMDEWDDE